MPSSEVMPKWKAGKLHSGSKTGPKVKSQKQAVAIMLSEKRAEKANGGKYPGKAMGGPMMGNPMGPGVAGPMGMTPGGVMPQMPMPQNANVMQQPQMGVAGGQVMPTAPRQLAVGGIAMPGVGGFNMAKEAHLNTSPMLRSEDRNVMHGPVLSAVSGRTDAHKTAVPSGSYVVPADIVSGRGQGNTLAGMNILQSMFKMGPYGTGAGSIKPGRGAPGAMGAPKAQSIMAAKGGGKQHGPIGKPVPVHLAGGELVVPPQNLMQTVHPNLKMAHEIMDRWVIKERKKLRKTLGKLPGPVKD